MDEREGVRGAGGEGRVMNGEVMGKGMMFGADVVWCRSPAHTYRSSFTWCCTGVGTGQVTVLRVY